jgi:hypothetical protein
VRAKKVAARVIDDGRETERHRIRHVIGEAALHARFVRRTQNVGEPGTVGSDVARVGRRDAGGREHAPAFVVDDAARRVADLHVDGMIGDRRGQLLARRQAFLRELPRRKSADRDDPLAGLGLSRRGRERCFELRDRAGRLETFDERTRCLRSAHEVRVPVDQSRDRGAPSQVDDLHARLVSRNGLPDREKPLVAYPDGAHRSIRCIHRENRPVRENPVAPPGAGARGLAPNLRAAAENAETRDERTPRSAARRARSWPFMEMHADPPVCGTSLTIIGRNR